jgi:hypothetical protein
MIAANFRKFFLITGCFAIGATTSSAQTTTAQTYACGRLQEMLDQYKQMHESCLAAHRGEKEVQETSEICSHPACQAYHSYVYGTKGQELGARIAACLNSERVAGMAADSQRQQDADQMARYGDAAADANQLADQYNNQAAGIQPYAMSGDMAQDIDGMRSAATSLAAQQNDFGSTPPSNDGTVSADSYMGSTSSGASDFDASVRAAARDVLDQGIQNVVGQENYSYYTDAKNLASGDAEKQLGAGYDLADKFNDKYNSGASQAVTHAMLPKLHNVSSNILNTVDAMGHAVSCITSSDPNCTNAGSQLQQQLNKLLHNPFGKPTNDLSDLFKVQ